MKYSSVFLYFALSLFVYSLQAQNSSALLSSSTVSQLDTDPLTTNPSAFSSVSSSSQTSPAPSVYTCQIDNNCLNDLYDHLLNKESPHSVYQHCKNTLSKSTACCASPSQCEEDFGRENAQVLRENSSSSTQRNCPKGPESIVILQQAQNMICDEAIKNCKDSCLEKLKELKKTFKQCFFIPHKDSIEKALEKAQTAIDPACYQEMNKIAHQYKDQSLHQASLFTEDIKTEDIVNCEEIEKEKNQKNLQAFFLNICQKVQPQQQQGIEKNKLRRQSVNHFKSQGAGLRSAHPSGVQPHAQNFSKNQALLGAGAVAGLGLLPSPVKKTEDKGLSQNRIEDKSLAQNLEGTEDKNLATDQALTDKAVSGDDKKPEKDNKSTAESTKEEDDKLRAKKAEEDESRAKNTEDQGEGSSLAKDEKKAGQNSSTAAQNKKPNALKTGQDSRLKGSSSPTKARTSVENQKQKRRKQNSQKKTTSKAQSKTSSQKRASKNSSSRSKGAKTETSSSANQIKMAQVSRPSNKCPVSTPYIQSAIVFQSVEAPQIEPMKKQDYFPYGNYDLVKGKPAGVLVHINRENIDRKKEFALYMYIAGSKRYIEKCFHSPFASSYKNGPPDPLANKDQDFCFWTRSDLKKEGYHKFFPLPKEILNKKRRNLTVKLVIYPRGYSKNKACLKQSFFRMNVIKTGSLKLGFTRIKARRNCRGYRPTRFQTVEDFAYSKEVTSYIESMFPVEQVSSKALRYTLEGSSFDYVEGSCDNSLSLKLSTDDDIVTNGFLSDIDWLSQVSSGLKRDKLFAVVPESYFRFHGQVNDRGKTPAGVVFTPNWREAKLKDGLWNLWGLLAHFRLKEEGINIGGSWNVAFVGSDQKNQGTVVHELSHTLGQGREFYKKKDSKQKVEMCQRFKGEPLEVCHKYKIPLALRVYRENGKRLWQFVKKKYSIMNNRGKLEDQWIDRDTYQKIFFAFSKFGAVISDWIDLYKEVQSQRKQKNKVSLKVILSGFYYEKKDQFKVPRIRIRKTSFKTGSFPKTNKIPVLTFQLREKDRILGTIRQGVLKTNMELLYKDKSSKTVPFPFVHAVASFVLPEDYKKRDLRIVVLTPQGKQIYSAPVPKKKKKRKKKKTKDNQNIVWIDKTYEKE